MHDLSHNVRQSPEAAGVAAPASRPAITVAICTRNRVALLEKAVRSVLAQADDRVEILIVDNGSTDGTAELVGKFTAANPRVRTVREPQTGVSVARALALREAKGEWVIFLDDDTTISPGWLAAYKSFFIHPPNERIAVVGGAVIPNYETAPPAWMIPGGNEIDFGAKLFCLPAPDHPWESNCAYRREAALQAGGFDERLGHHGETLGCGEGPDLNRRLRAAGCEVWWLPDAPVHHRVHAHRLTLRYHLRMAFGEGRSNAVQRMRDRATGLRWLCAGGRMAHCGLNVLVALATFPLQHGRRAARALRRAAISAGFACELLKQL